MLNLEALQNNETTQAMVALTKHAVSTIRFARETETASARRRAYSAYKAARRLGIRSGFIRDAVASKYW